MKYEEEEEDEDELTNTSSWGRRKEWIWSLTNFSKDWMENKQMYLKELWVIIDNT